MNIIEFGDCRDTMRKWKEQGIKAQTCVTSPPYYGLRDYGHEGQIGLEETPEEYIKAMVEVFRCVWDVLEDDGTLWLNIGDSYARNAGPEESKLKTLHTMGVGQKKAHEMGAMRKGENKPPAGCKPKDLIGIPWLLAFALRADGWYLRQDIIWHKPNPMPESVTDRCTKAHEYIFLMSKKQKYYYDIEPIREQIKPSTDGQASVRRSGDSKTRSKEHWGVPHNPENVIVQYEEIKGANKRSVWSVPTKPYTGAHFAVFPEELIEPCIMAGAPVGGIVLDPFMGSGTTAQVAQHLGRQYLGCELNPDYKLLQKKRVAQQSLELA
jgi:DNA modification methylase